MHGKNASDGAKGSVKSMSTTSVCAEGTLIRNVVLFYDFLKICESYPVLPSIPRKKHGLSHRLVFVIERAENVSLRKSLGQCPYKTVQGTQKIHQMTN